MTTPELPRETHPTVLVTWAIRVGIVGIILFAIQHYLGPFEFLWWAWPAYAALSLIASLLMAKIKNAKIDQLTEMIEQTQGRDT